nr:immunoglobulin heavy chain junction region [Mus musculus]
CARGSSYVGYFDVW